MYPFADEIYEMSLTDVHGNLEKVSRLMSLSHKLLLEFCATASEDYQVDMSELYAHVERRLRVGSIAGDGVATIIQTVRTVADGRLQISDRDILAGALARPHPARAFLNYLYKFVDSKAKTLAERGGRKATISLDEVAEPSDGHESDFETTEHSTFILERIRLVINTLPEDQRSAIQAYYFGEKGTQKQVAKRLGITRDQLQGLLKNAYERIRNRLPVGMAF